MNLGNTARSSDTHRRCQNCGDFVTQQFSRVFGNNADEVYGCLSCRTARDLREGHQLRPSESAP
ncbi:DUF7563 family protein [Halomarina litorea]|uniref:DUF7563 family protein n=1 Tax=Halomarina litorea TaxID=2961595 RepID=UPI0020C25325|nr:hypothetical protein [Halomarina sp. BCD28]